MDTPLSSLFQFISPFYNTSLDITSNLRAGIVFNTPYLLITEDSEWIAPHYWKTQNVEAFVVGGGGAGGQYTLLGVHAGKKPLGNGTPSSLARNNVTLSSAKGGLHGHSRYLAFTDPVAPESAGEGGRSDRPPSNGGVPSSKPVAPFLLHGKGGSHGKPISSQTDASTGGGGAAGFLPFGWETPSRWKLPFSSLVDDRVTFSYTSPHSGKNGTGFGAGGGAEAPTKDAFYYALFATYIGASGGQNGALKHFSFSVSPRDTLSFVIGKGGSLRNKPPLAPGNGYPGMILLLFPHALNLFPPSLPQPNLNPYTLSPTPHILKTSMESGAVRQRNTSLLSYHSLSCSWTFSQEQYSAFSQWFHSDIQNGANSFAISIMTPAGIQTVSARFSEPFRAQLSAHNLWSVHAQLQVFFPTSNPKA